MRRILLSSPISPMQEVSRGNKHVLILIGLFSLILNLYGCTMGPNYTGAPCIDIPDKYKEAAPGWKVASPCDDCDKGDWWKIYKDPELTCLLERIDVSNQNLKKAEAQYRQAIAILKEARAAYFPTVVGNASALRQQNSFGSFTNGTGSTTSSVTTLGTDSSNLNTNYSVSLTANWEPDLWGTVRRTVEANAALAQMSQAQLEAVRLSMQTTLVQTYFELRYVDSNQRLLEKTVQDYKKALELTKNRYKSGVSYSLDVVQAETQLSSAEAQAIDNRINRALYEHAIAVLVGEPPSCFCLAEKPLREDMPKIPAEIPCELLERRPDIAAAERLVAASNAQIGVAIAAFYPTMTLTGTFGHTSSGLGNLFSEPTKFWSLGVNLAETIFDGGLRLAVLEATNAVYDQNVASYRQTVLTAFQAVEDNLSTLSFLKKEIVKQRELVNNAERVLNITTNQYKAGTQQYTNVVLAQISLFTARKNYNDIRGRQMVASAALVSALGGGWDKACLTSIHELSLVNNYKCFQ